MTTEPRLGACGQTFRAVGAHEETADPSDPSGSSREIDERTAVCLLTLARELLRRDHSAIAGMIDYAIAEIEGERDDID